MNTIAGILLMHKRTEWSIPKNEKILHSIVQADSNTLLDEHTVSIIRMLLEHDPDDMHTPKRIEASRALLHDEYSPYYALLYSTAQIKNMDHDAWAKSMDCLSKEECFDLWKRYFHLEQWQSVEHPKMNRSNAQLWTWFLEYLLENQVRQQTTYNIRIAEFIVQSIDSSCLVQDELFRMEWMDYCIGLFDHSAATINIAYDYLHTTMQHGDTARWMLIQCLDRNDGFIRQSMYLWYSKMYSTIQPVEQKMCNSLVKWYFQKDITSKYIFHTPTDPSMDFMMDNINLGMARNLHTYLDKALHTQEQQALDLDGIIDA